MTVKVKVISEFKRDDELGNEETLRVDDEMSLTKEEADLYEAKGLVKRDNSTRSQAPTVE